MENCSPVAMPLLADKNGTVLYDCIVPIIYEFTYAIALNLYTKLYI